MPQQSHTDSQPNPKSKRRIRWKRYSLWLLLLLLIFLLRPGWHLWTARGLDVADRPATPSGFVDDASAMNQTRVKEVWKVPEDRTEAEQQIKELLAEASRQNLKVSIAGARHSMGGHTIAPEGVVIDMTPLRHMSLDESGKILTVGAGAIWHDVLAYLDPRGRSVQVMQSNDSFSVGGSISVNCHGWQYGKPPIASTVQSFRLMKADGEIVHCSRSENPELFSLVLGGYGLFGVILDLELITVPNVRYRVDQRVVSAVDAIAAYREILRRGNRPAMGYARMDVSQHNFLNEVLLCVMVEDPPKAAELEPIAPAGLTGIRRTIFRGSANSDYGKRFRWDAETKLHRLLRVTHVTRNQLMDEGVEVFENRSDATTDILHEYFIPADRFASFVLMLQKIIPESDANLLNVTVRAIERDQDTFLAYADRPMLSAVMLFQQPRNAGGDAEMKKLTQQLIDAAIETGGRYYLPYRLHASKQQFHRCYPQAKAFFAKKREYDPDERFLNRFYLRYGEPDVVSQTD